MIGGSLSPMTSDEDEQDGHGASDVSDGVAKSICGIRSDECREQMGSH
jgi:hypothetical protein